MLLVLTEEQHAVVASQELFRWFSGPEDVLRVVLRVVLGSETLGTWMDRVWFFAT
jgi:hypothetical protein